MCEYRQLRGHIWNDFLFVITFVGIRAAANNEHQLTFQKYLTFIFQRAPFAPLLSLSLSISISAKHLLFPFHPPEWGFFFVTKNVNAHTRMPSELIKLFLRLYCSRNICLFVIEARTHSLVVVDCGRYSFFFVKNIARIMQEIDACALCITQTFVGVKNAK